MGLYFLKDVKELGWCAVWMRAFEIGRSICPFWQYSELLGSIQHRNFCNTLEYLQVPKTNSVPRSSIMCRLRMSLISLDVCLSDALSLLIFEAISVSFERRLASLAGVRPPCDWIYVHQQTTERDFAVHYGDPGLKSRLRGWADSFVFPQSLL